MKPEKQPKDHVWCPVCGRPYGFIRCRITLRNPTRNLCMACAVEEEEEAKKRVTLEPLPVRQLSMDDVENVEAAPAEEVAEEAEAETEATETE